jgi:hypothetical protein
MVGATPNGSIEGFLQSPDQVEGSESGRLHRAGLYCGVVGSGRLVPRGVALIGFLLSDRKKCKYSLQFEAGVTEQLLQRRGQVAPVCGGACATAARSLSSSSRSSVRLTGPLVSAEEAGLAQQLCMHGTTAEK